MSMTEETMSMTLEEAIEWLQIMLNNMENRGYPHESKALKLGIEALKRHQDMERQSYPEAYPPLPGETEE